MGGVAAIPGRGRKAKPQEDKKARGNPGGRKLNKAMPEFSQVVDIDPPEYFDGLEFAPMIWRSIVPELLKAQVLRITDMHNVEAFCIAYENYRQAQIKIRENGITVVGGMGSVGKNPAVTVLNEAMKQMSMFGAMLGLEPSSRQRLTGVGNKEKTNSFASVLNM